MRRLSSAAFCAELYMCLWCGACVFKRLRERVNEKPQLGTKEHAEQSEVVLSDREGVELSKTHLRRDELVARLPFGPLIRRRHARLHSLHLCQWRRSWHHAHWCAGVLGHWLTF